MVGMHIDRMNDVSRAYSVPIVRIVKAMQFQLGLSSTSPHSVSQSIHHRQRESLLQSLAQGESINEKKSLRQADQQKLRR